jgi:hypothetical protein
MSPTPPQRDGAAPKRVPLTRVRTAADSRRAADVMRPFTDEVMTQLIHVERGLTVIDAGLAGSEGLRGFDERFRTIADAAAPVGQTLMQEVAREAEMLVVAFSGRPKSFGPVQADVVRHVVDVLSLMVHDLRRRMENKPPANVSGAAVMVRERMRHALREIGHQELPAVEASSGGGRGRP